MKISIGCDEAAYELKEAIKKRLEETGHTYVDNGVEAGETALYPDVAVKTCERVTSGECDRGILVCGTGIGMAMTANKVPGIRAPQLALYLLDIWMGLEFKDGPSTEKVERITYYEKQFSK